MKDAIHPKYFDTAEIKCSCGTVIVVGSTREHMKTELCSKCHPFYTGQQKLVDTAGRVDKFQAKRKKSVEIHEEAARHAEMKKKKPEAYQEKEISPEVPAKTMAVEKKQAEGKWGGPLGDAPAQEVKKEQIAAKKKKLPMKKAPVKIIAKKTSVKKPAAKKTTKKKK